MLRLATAGGQGAEGRVYPPPAPGPVSGDVPVTRPQSLTGETGATGSEPFFVDWITVSQVYPDGGLPCVDAGAVWAADADGVIEWRTVKAVQHEGSYETRVNVKCDGYRVTLSGNIGRFGRPDNLFGHGVSACVQKANEVLSHYGLPPFTAGVRFERAKRGDVEYQWTGARISRLDLTANYEAGSEDNAHLVMQFLATQHNGRKAGRTLGDGETVDWGSGSRKQYWKVYVKHRELMRHGCTDQRLVDHCRSVGLVRFEGTLRSDTLTRQGCAFLGDYESGWAMGQLVNLFNQHAAVMSRAHRATDDLDELPRHLRATARDYLAGMDVTCTLSRATFYRHRRELLAFGLDISMRNVRAFQPRVRVVELVRAEVPTWYQLAA